MGRVSNETRWPSIFRSVQAWARDPINQDRPIDIYHLYHEILPYCSEHDAALFPKNIENFRNIVWKHNTELKETFRIKLGKSLYGSPTYTFLSDCPPHDLDIIAQAVDLLLETSEPFLGPMDIRTLQSYLESLMFGKDHPPVEWPSTTVGFGKRFSVLREPIKERIGKRGYKLDWWYHHNKLIYQFSVNS